MNRSKKIIGIALCYIILSSSAYSDSIHGIKKENYLKIKISSLRLLLPCLTLIHSGAMANCNVCKNGGSIVNPNKEFTMSNPQTGESHDWTCGFLEESLADVQQSGGAPGEAFLCSVGQLWAKKECLCSGNPLPPNNNNIHSQNPACDMCATISGNEPYDFDYVPEELADQMVETGISNPMPCGGLYLAMALGVLNVEHCPIVQENA